VTPGPGQIWLVRHGETEWSATGKHTSTTDVELTEEGVRAARALGERLAGRDYALVLTSPMQRARETCELAGLGDGAEVDEDLMEFRYGEYEGLTTPEIRERRPSWYLWRDGVPNGEAPDDVAARCDRVIAEVLQIDGTVALVAHGHILRALGARWIEEPVALGGRLHLSTGSISVLGFERDVRVIRTWNA
jgi:broad specificity phosphatase PhoE